MYIGTAIFLIALGAVLRWAVDWHVNGFDIQLAGLIVFLIGILGLVITLVLWLSPLRSTGRTILRLASRIPTSVGADGPTEASARGLGDCRTVWAILDLNQ
jgi:hypothetical protein